LHFEYRQLQFRYLPEGEMVEYDHDAQRKEVHGNHRFVQPEVTLKAKVTLKNSHGKVDYIQKIKACHTAGSCKTGEVGIETT
jgi:hypothetical protein